jgi:hypothetical protein
MMATNDPNSAGCKRHVSRAPLRRNTNHAFQQRGCNTAARYLFADDWAGPLLL